MKHLLFGSFTTVEYSENSQYTFYENVHDNGHHFKGLELTRRDQRLSFYRVKGKDCLFVFFLNTVYPFVKYFKNKNLKISFDISLYFMVFLFFLLFPHGFPILK